MTRSRKRIYKEIKQIMATRELTIDTDTCVGYNFLLQNFYVTNKGTTTYRDNATATKTILDIVAPSSTITEAQILALKTNAETLTNLYYTWYDTGAFVKTIQVNDFSKYPIVLDALKHKLYIMNSNLIFDLDLNEGKQHRIDYMISYFQEKLGVTITNTEMGKIYDLLMTYYEPHVYNEIDLTKLTDTLTELYYNNIYSLANHSETYPITYTCTENPNNLYSYANLAGIIGLDQTEKLITLQSTPNTILEEGQTININNLITTIDGIEYTADGDYTVAEHTGNKIYIEESLPFNYSFPYKTCTLTNSITNISSIDRINLKITLTNSVPNTIQVGDTIYVSGTTRTEDNQVVTADGSYTVASISGSYVIVQEQPPINYTYSSGTYPTVSKHILLGNITSISSKKCNLDKSVSVSANAKVLIDGTEYTVASSTSTSVTVSEDIANYTPVYPQVRTNTAYPEVMVDVTTSDSDQFPTGEFMVDNYSQAIAYIKTYSTDVIAPTLTNHTNVNTQVSTELPTITGLPTLELKGVYSKIYTDK